LVSGTLAAELLKLRMDVLPPAASVVMTTYNGSRYVRETIESILNQSFKDFEFIIIDDCSSDNTVEIVNSYKDNRIKFFQNQKNLGISRTRNRGLELARGNYIFATDQDDVSLPCRLEVQIRFMQEHPDMVMIGSSAKEWRNGEISSVYKPESRPEILHWRLFSRCGIVHSSICIRNDILKRYSICYDPAYHYAEDFVLFHKLAERGRIAILPDDLVIYREHETNASVKFNSEMEQNGQLFLQSQFLKALNLDVDSKLINKYWSVFVIGAANYELDDVIAVGELYFKAFNTFLTCHQFAHSQLEELTEFAVLDWWNSVCRCVNSTGNIRLMSAFTRVVNDTYFTLQLKGVMRCFPNVLFKQTKRVFAKFFA